MKANNILYAKQSANKVVIAVAKINAGGVALLNQRIHISAEERQTIAGQIPYGRPIRPDEIGKTVKWLVFDSPEAMTGSLIAVSGGWEY